MESKIDEILKQLHQFLFADSQQITVELRHYLHDFTYQESDLGKCTHILTPSSFYLLQAFQLSRISSRVFAQKLQ